MVGGKQEDAARREKEERLKDLRREIRQLRLQAEREAEQRAIAELSDPDGSVPEDE